VGAQHLEALGHEVIVADPNYAAMYATRSRRVKTDRRDARTLADACRLGAYHPLERVTVPATQAAAVAPLVELLTPLNAAIARPTRGWPGGRRPTRSRAGSPRCPGSAP
jgi:transposase